MDNVGPHVSWTPKLSHLRSPEERQVLARSVRVGPAVQAGMAASVAVGLWLATGGPLSADLTPKPTMDFELVYEIPPVEVLSGELIECGDPACTSREIMPMPPWFECTSEGCHWSGIPGDGPVKLVLEFADRKRVSSVFQRRGYASSYVVAVGEEALDVTWQPSRSPYFHWYDGLAFPVALAITLFVELVVSAAYSRATAAPRVLRWVAVANLASLPIVWFLLRRLALDIFGYMLTAFAFAFVLEALFFYFALRRRGMTGRHALALSLAINLASVIVGLPVNYFNWMP